MKEPVYKHPVYKHIARLLDAFKRCEQTNNLRAPMYKERLMRISKEHMPSGSGFDAGTTLDINESTPNKLVFLTSYHHMNDGGFYDGWTAHKVIVTPSLVFGFDIKITGRDRRNIKDYMGDVFHDSLNVEIDPYAVTTGN